MGTINEDLGRLRTGGDKGRCARCKATLPNGELDYLATVERKVRQVVCLERKACDERRRAAREARAS